MGNRGIIIYADLRMQNIDTDRSDVLSNMHKSNHSSPVYTFHCHHLKEE